MLTEALPNGVFWRGFPDPQEAGVDTRNSGPEFAGRFPAFFRVGGKIEKSFRLLDFAYDWTHGLFSGLRVGDLLQELKDFDRGELRPTPAPVPQPAERETAAQVTTPTTYSNQRTVHLKRTRLALAHPLQPHTSQQCLSLFSLAGRTGHPQCGGERQVEAIRFDSDG